MLTVGDTLFPGEEHTNWLSNTKWLALETSIQAIYRLNMLYLGLKIHPCVHVHICIYMHIYLYNNNQKERGKWCNYAIILKNKRINFLKVSFQHHEHREKAGPSPEWIIRLSSCKGEKREHVSVGPSWDGTMAPVDTWRTLTVFMSQLRPLRSRRAK